MITNASNVVQFNPLRQDWCNFGIDVEDAASAIFWLDHYQYIAHRACRIGMEGSLSFQKNFNPNAYFMWELKVLCEKHGIERSKLVQYEEIILLDSLPEFDLERLAALGRLFAVGYGCCEEELSDSFFEMNEFHHRAHPSVSHIVARWVEDLEAILPKWAAHVGASDRIAGEKGFNRRVFKHLNAGYGDEDCPV